MAVATTTTFADRLAAEVERKHSQLVVGLDPNIDLMPVELRGDVARFCCGLIDSVAPHAVAVKPQLAFFEALGPAGMAAFDQVCTYARRAGLLVVADGKRGDIGSTARAYAEAYLEGEPPRADALTVNPWLGRDSVEPFLGAVRRGGVGIFVVVRTSNASGDLQDAVLKDGRPMWHYVAGLVDEWGEGTVGEVGLNSVGAVVGATHPRAVAEARRLMPRSILLLPGIGAQGGAVSDLTRAFQSGPASALVNAARSINYAFRETGSDYREAAGAEAARLKQEIWGCLRLVVIPDDWRRYLAPAAFLLAATIAVVLVRSGIESGGGRHVATAGSPPRGRHVVVTSTTSGRSPTKRFWVVRAGDTFAVISSKSGVPVATLVRLNPKVHSTSLFIGERIRLR